MRRGREGGAGGEGGGRVLGDPAAHLHRLLAGGRPCGDTQPPMACTVKSLAGMSRYGPLLTEVRDAHDGARPDHAGEELLEATGTEVLDDEVGPAEQIGRRPPCSRLRLPAF